MDCKQFILDLCEFYGSLYVAMSVAEDAAEDAAEDSMVRGESWDDTRNQAWESVGNTIRNSVGNAILDVVEDGSGPDRLEDTLDAAWDAVRNTTLVVAQNAARIVTPNAAKGVYSRQMAYVICRSIILDRKKISKAVESKVKDRLPDIILISERKMEVIRRLMTYNDKERLKKTIPLQLHYILFTIERLIKVDFTSQLMEKHRKLVKDLEMEKTYLSLFNATISKEELTSCWPSSHYLPEVLVAIIVSYTELSCQNLDDENIIISRILLVPNT